jgi:hypothetical protein
MSDDLTEKNRDVSRRTIVKGAAWSVPAIAVAVAAPLATASASIPPGVVVTPGNGPWTDAQSSDGWIAEGVEITLADANGNPLPAGTAVTLTISRRANGSGWVRNNFWFVNDPTLSADAGRQQSQQRQSITLVTTLPGRLSLYPTATTGYLRKGSNGESDGQYLTVTVGSTSQQVKILNSSAAGGTNPGIRPA